MTKTCDNKNSCPITQVAELLSDTWTMLIMRALNEGPKRFCELERWLGDISSRTLTRKLKILTEQKMIHKGDNGLYYPSEKGAGLCVITKAMEQYANKHL